MGYTEPVLHPKEAQPGDVLLFRNLSDQIFHSELIYMNDPKAYCASSGTDGVFWVRRNDLHNVFKDDLDQHFCYNYYWKIFNHGGRIAGGVIIEGGLEIWRNPNPTPIEFIPPGGGGN
jgi:hypothetical protein